jgi:tetratricopeptide (TPR) repeat protein
MSERDRCAPRAFYNSITTFTRFDPTNNADALQFHNRQQKPRQRSSLFEVIMSQRNNSFVNGRFYLILVTATLAVLFAALVERARAQTASSAVEQATALLNQQKWAEAAQAFESITKSEPANALAWFRLGQALHGLGHYDRALEVYQKADALHFNHIGVMYRMGRTYARLGENRKAIEALDGAVKAGLPFQMLKSDVELAALSSDPAFNELLARAERIAKPCQFEPQFKQFDFWVGEWDVKPTQALQAPSVGASSIQRLEDGCIILENWTGAAGGTGKSMNFYNQNTHQWQQTWVSSNASILEYHGEYRDGAMRFEGETSGADGKKVRNRLTFFNLGPDRVRQLAEQSDDGKTWTVRYDFTYLRR